MSLLTVVGGKVVHADSPEGQPLSSAVLRSVNSSRTLHEAPTSIRAPVVARPAAAGPFCDGRSQAAPLSSRRRPPREDLRQISNLAACYTEGIDALGASKVDAGTAIWSRCFAEDAKFSLSFGAFSVTCPGERCPMPASMTGLARRVGMARSTYERAGYVATSHHVTDARHRAGRRDDGARSRGTCRPGTSARTAPRCSAWAPGRSDARLTPGRLAHRRERLDSPLRVDQGR